MRSSLSSPPGAFPLSGPVTYIATSCAEVEGFRAANYPAPTTWFHGTTLEAAISACWQGLIPSCWCGGDSCCVFGVDELAAIAPHHDWPLEIHSAALPGQLKAWWVPPQAVRGAWNDGLFYEAAELRDMGIPLLEPQGCRCEIAEKTREEIEKWRAVVGRELASG